jgi:transcriptional regulator with XRE-family HTH domain
MPTVAEAFAALLTEAREKADLTQERLGLIAGVDRSTVGALERGLVASPKLETVMRLASAMEIDPCELIPALHLRTTAGGPRVEEWVFED